MERRPLPIEAEMAQRSIGLLGFAKQAGHNLLSVIPEATKQNLYVKGPAQIHYICDPEKISEILVGQAANFPKSQVTKNILGSAVGNGMILSEGQIWKDQRRRYAPLFAARNLPELAETFAKTGAELGQKLADAKGEVDVAELAQHASLTDISRVMFSGSETVEPEQIRDGLATYTAYVADMSLFDLLGLPPWIPRLKWLKSKAPVFRMRDLARNVIETRREKNRPEPEDFLDLMIAALREDQEEIDQTIDNLLTFVVAGHETAANTLTWGLYLLAMFPDVQEALRDEIDAVCGDGPISYTRMLEMPWLDRHVKETLRLYPAAAFFARDVAADVTLGDLHLKKGDAVFLPIYALHRHAKLWDDPNAYWPERFDGFTPPRGQYIPFGDGPRVCIGAQYAITEIKVLLASIIRQARLSLSDQPIPRPVVTVTMHPEAPLFLRVEPL